MDVLGWLKSDGCSLIAVVGWMYSDFCRDGCSQMDVV